ncbi:MAG: pilus assembly protein PilP [Deltaproteobacteria bacterium]|nr:pilus assembly protein PilP [Deltaproteobacteria bacterium]
MTALMVGVLALLVPGAGAPRSWAAETKAAPAAPAPVATAKAGTKGVPAAPPPAVLPGPKAQEASAAATAPGAKEPPPAPPVAPPEFIYSTAGKSDPFKPFIDTNPAPQKKPEGEVVKKKTAPTGRPISPLQQADVEQFRLLGIVGSDAGRSAMVEDGVAKKYYPLVVGTYIGTNGGRVVSILSDRVIVEEKVAIEGKKTQTRRVTLVLHRENEGKP